MEAGLLAKKRFGKQAEGLDDHAGRNVQAACHATALENTAAQVRFRVAIRAAGTQNAILDADRTQNLCAITEPIVNEPPPRRRAPLPMWIDWSGLSVFRVKPPSSPILHPAPTSIGPPLATMRVAV